MIERGGVVTTQSLGAFLQGRYGVLKNLDQLPRRINGVVGVSIVALRNDVRNLAVLDLTSDEAISVILHEVKLITKQIKQPQRRRREQIDIFPSFLKLVELLWWKEFWLPIYFSWAHGIQEIQVVLVRWIVRFDFGKRLRLIEHIKRSLQGFGIIGSVLLESVQLGFEAQIGSELASIPLDEGNFLCGSAVFLLVCGTYHCGEIRNHRGADTTTDRHHRGRNWLKVPQGVVPPRCRWGTAQSAHERVVQALVRGWIGHTSNLVCTISGCPEAPV